MRTYVPRCGDVMRSRHDTSETVTVAYVEGAHFSWWGWPEGLARLDDWECVERCSDEEHAKAVDEWRRASPSQRRSDVLRIYGTEAERNPPPVTCPTCGGSGQVRGQT